MPIERYYSINSLARIFDNSKDFWRKKVALGEIKAVKVGRSLRIPESEVKKIILKDENTLELEKAEEEEKMAKAKINAILP